MSDRRVLVAVGSDPAMWSELLQDLVPRGPGTAAAEKDFLDVPRARLA